MQGQKQLLKFSSLAPLLFGFYWLFFVVYILFPSSCIRLSVDDLAIGHISLKYGIAKGSGHVWMTSSGRYITTILMLFFGYWASLHSQLAGIFGVLMTLLLLFSIAFFLRALTSAQFSKALNWSVVFLVHLFFATPNIDETWFWLAGQISYLIPIACLLFTCGLYIRQGRWSVFLLAFITTGGNESLSFIFLLVATGLFLLNPKKNKFLFSGVALGFCILYFSVANTVRANAIGLAPLNFFDTLILTGKLIGPFIFFMVKRRIMDLGILLFFSIVMFKDLSLKLQIKKIWIIGAFSSLIFLYLIPAARVTHGLPPDRSHITAALIILVSLAMATLSYFDKSNIKPTLLGLFLILAIVNLVSVASRHQQRWRQTLPYALAYDSYFESLIISASLGGQLETQKLPPSGMVYPSYGFPEVGYFKLIDAARGH